MRDWMVERIDTGKFNVTCDECGSACTRRYVVLRNRHASTVRYVGTDCSFKLAGTITPTLVKAPEVAETGDMPDWMC